MTKEKELTKSDVEPSFESAEDSVTLEELREIKKQREKSHNSAFDFDIKKLKKLREERGSGPSGGYDKKSSKKRVKKSRSSKKAAKKLEKAQKSVEELQKSTRKLQKIMEKY